ncbi:MAG: hypothetical protein NTU94_04270 [Planctomycetota bacterium]|nr:hypothetical protein [Planctomycetota bacterium]
MAIKTATALLLAGWVLSSALADDLAPLWARAQQGDAHAQVRMGILCRDGKGTAHDYAQALEWFAKAAKTGDAAALDNLGWMNEHGLGTGVDFLAAARYYRASADKGHGQGIYNFARMADVTSPWLELLKRKPFSDLSGNNINHPNNFGHRVYAEVICQLFPLATETRKNGAKASK